MCGKREKRNLVLEGDKEASAPGPTWQLVWQQIRRQDANGTANFVGLLFFLPVRGMVNTKSFL